MFLWITLCRILTLIVIFGGDGEYRMLNVFIFIYLRFIKGLVEVRRIIVFVGDANSDEFGDCNKIVQRQRELTLS